MVISPSATVEVEQETFPTLVLALVLVILPLLLPETQLPYLQLGRLLVLAHWAGYQRKGARKQTVIISELYLPPLNFMHTSLYSTQPLWSQQDHQPLPS